MTRKTQKRRKAAARHKRTAANRRNAKRRRQRPQGLRTERSRILGPEESLVAASGGQSGDTQQLSREEDADSQSVEDLAETGQYFEADIIEGVERASTIAGKRAKRGMKVRRTLDRPPKKDNTL